MIPPDPPTPPMTRDEWLERFAQRIVQQAAFSIEQARHVANAEEFDTLSDGYEDDPEGAADMEMSYWSD